MCLEPDSLSSALACPLDLGARPPCRRLRARVSRMPSHLNHHSSAQNHLYGSHLPREIGPALALICEDACDLLASTSLPSFPVFLTYSASLTQDSLFLIGLGLPPALDLCAGYSFSLECFPPDIGLPGAGFRPRPRPFLGLPERRQKALGGTRVWSRQVLLRP